MPKATLRGLLSSLWICVLSCVLSCVFASFALGKMTCDRGETSNPQICKDEKSDARGCCKVPKRKKQKAQSKSESNNMFSIKEFGGVGLKSDFYYNSQGADISLGIAARNGILGVVGFGGVGSVDYRFNSHIISGHAGIDTYLLVVGLQLALAWQVDRQQKRADFGINYGLKLLLPNAYPMFFMIGGQSYMEAPTEFLISFSIFTSFDGRPLERGKPIWR